MLRSQTVWFRRVAPLANCSPPPIDQQRRANLGKMVEQLRERVPQLLHELIPKLMVSQEVVLKIHPHGNHLPKFSGHVPYYATCKALQLVMMLVVLNSHAEIHIQSMKVTNDDSPTTECPGSTKICVRWSSCPPRCFHLAGEATLAAKLGAFTWKDVDMTRNVGLGALRGLASHANVERVLCGIFVFELNRDCDQIVVHSIEDVDTIEEEEVQVVPRPC